MIHPAAGGASRTIVVSGASETSVNHGKSKRSYGFNRYDLFTFMAML